MALLEKVNEWLEETARYKCTSAYFKRIKLSSLNVANTTLTMDQIEDKADRYPIITYICEAKNTQEEAISTILSKICKDLVGKELVLRRSIEILDSETGGYIAYARVACIPKEI